MDLLQKARHVAHSEGYLELASKAPGYILSKTIRPFAPKIEGFHYKNGIPYETKRITDILTPSTWADEPEYEAALISAVREQVHRGDTVGIIGGGLGISAVAAATETGETGEVVVYEASSERINQIYRTVDLNDVSNIVEVQHALIGPALGVYGDSGEAMSISPADLPDVDVLEMDCEGAEVEILSNLSLRPRVIIVEVHPPRTTEEEVRDILSKLEYQITNKEWENENSDNPLPVLTAKFNTNS
jgi:hypothetical protein